MPGLGADQLAQERQTVLRVRRGDRVEVFGLDGGPAARRGEALRRYGVQPEMPSRWPATPAPSQPRSGWLKGPAQTDTPVSRSRREGAAAGKDAMQGSEMLGKGS